MEKLFNRLTIAGFLLIIFTFCLGTFLSEHKEKLFYENRYTEKAVPLTMESYTSGEFVQKAEKSFSDNIYRRDEMLKLYTLTNRYILGKNEVNKVVFGDGVLLPYYSTNYFDADKTDRDINFMTNSMGKLNQVVEKNGGKLIFTA